ncbi:MAG: hypothetical protein PVJ78_01070, partial [Gammaproteobacteria bacterium]
MLGRDPVADPPQLGNVVVDAGGSVVVAADSTTLIESYAGTLGLSLSGTAVGVSVGVVVDIDKTHAIVGDGAQITALGNGDAASVRDGVFTDDEGNQGSESVRGLAVTSTSFDDVFLLAIAASGSLGQDNSGDSEGEGGSSESGGGTTVGIAGSVGVAILKGETRATLGAGADVNADNTGANAGQGILLRGSDETNVTNVTGGLAITIDGDAGITGSVTVNDVDNFVSARAMGDNTLTSSGGGVTVDADAKVDIDAVTIAVAGTVSTDSSSGDSGNSSSSDFVFTGAGAVTVNFVETEAIADIGAGSMVTTDGDLALSADDNSDITADSGGVAITVATNDGQTAGSVGASVAVNDIKQTISATATDTEVSAANFNADANNNASIDTLTIAGSAAVSSGGDAFGGAGSGSGNYILSTTRAGLVNESGTLPLTLTGDIDITATDASDINADAGSGALAISSGSGGDVGAVAAGAAAAVNRITKTTEAKLVGADTSLGSVGNVAVEANSTGTISAFTLGISGSLNAGQGSLALAGAGSGSGNEISSDVLALVESSDVDATGTVTVSATDSSSIEAIAGSVAISLGVGSGGTNVGVALGLSITINNIGNSALAIVDDSSISAGGAVEVSAESTSSIDSTAFGVSLSITASSGTNVSINALGAAASNSVNNTVEAAIVDSDTNDSESVVGGTVTVEASDETSLKAVGVAASANVSAGGSTNAGGSLVAAVVLNDIGNVTTAHIDGVDVTANVGDVQVMADSSADIEAIGVSASVGVGAGSGPALNISIGVSYAKNIIGNEIEAVIAGGADVSAAGNVTVSATDESSISADIAAASVSIAASSSYSITLTVSAVDALNEIGNTTRAAIEGTGTDVHADDSLSVLAVSSPNIDAIGIAAAVSVSAGSGLALSGAGTGAHVTNTVDNVTQAGVFSGAHADTTSGSVMINASEIAPGSGSRVNLDAVPVAFNGSDTDVVDVEGDRILVEGDWRTGDAVTYSDGGDTAIGGLSDGVVYYVIDNQDGSIRLAETREDALTRNAIDLLGEGTGLNHSLTGEADTIDLGDFEGASGWRTGNELLYSTGGGTAIGGLTDGGRYFVIQEGNGVIRLATTEENAEDGIYIDLTSLGTGGNHSFARITGDEVILDPDAKAVENDEQVVTFDGATALDTLEGNEIAFLGGSTVDTFNNTIEIGTNYWQTGDKVVYSNNYDGDDYLIDNDNDGEKDDVVPVSSIGGLSDGGTYYVIKQSDGKIKLATSYQNALDGTAKSLTSQGSVTDHSFTQQIDALEIGGHSFGTGDKLVYDSDGGTPIGGLPDGTYYAIVLDDNRIQLASTRADAEAGKEIELTGAGVGANHTFTRPNLDPVDIAADSIDFDSVGWTTGDSVLYASHGAGTDIGGLTEGESYFVIRLEDGRVQFATSKTNAENGVAKDLTSQGTGDEHSFVKLSEAPIVFNPDSSKDEATIQSTVVAASVGVGASSSAAVTLTIAVALADNAVNNQTSALIDGGDVDAGSTLTLDASASGLIDVVSVGVSASIAASSGPAIGLSGAGAEASNVVGGFVEAGIHNVDQGSGQNVTADGAVLLQSSNTSRIQSDAAAAAISVSASSGLSVGAAAAGAVADNEVTTETRSRILNSDISTTDTLTLDADSASSVRTSATAVAISVSGSGGVAAGGAGAGAESTNTVNAVTEAIIADSQVGMSGNLLVDALDNSSILAVVTAAAVSVSAGSGAGASMGISVALADNVIGGGTKSLIDNSTVTGATALDLSSDFSADILVVGTAAALSVGVGAGAGISVSGAGAEISNTISGETLALISNGSSLVVDGYADISATDSSSITSVVIAAALSVGASSGIGISGSVAVALGDNIQEGTTRAGVENSSLTTTNSGNVTILAENDSSLLSVGVAAALSVAVGAGAGISVSVAAAEVDNTITSTTEAVIGDGSSVISAGWVDMDAINGAEIDSIVVAAALSVGAGAGAGISGSVAVSLATNNVGGDTTAIIDDSYVDAATTVNVNAESSAEVEAWGVAAAISVGVGGGLGVSGAAGASEVNNTMTNTVQAVIQDTRALDSQGVFATDDVSVTASDLSLIESRSIAVSFSVGAGAGAGLSLSIAIALAQADVSTDVLALVSASDVDTTGGDVYITALNDSTIDTVATSFAGSVAGAGGFALSGAGAGANADNTTGGSTQALVQSGSNIDIGGMVDIDATNSADIDATVVTVSVSVGAAAGASMSLSVAALTASNTIGSINRAGIVGSTVDADAGVFIDALNDASIDATGASVSFSAAVAAGASVGVTVSVADVTNTSLPGSLTEAVISGGSMVTGPGVVELTATDSTSIDADVISVAAGVSGAIGGTLNLNIAAALVSNDLDASTAAKIEDSTVNVGGAVSLFADSDAVIDSFALGLAMSFTGAGGVALGGAVAATVAENAVGGATLATVDNSSVTTGDLDIEALSQSEIDSSAASVAIAVSGAVGASGALTGAGVKAINDMTHTTEASIVDGSMVTATAGAGTVTIDAEDRSQIVADITSVAASIGVAGGASLNISIGVVLAENMMGGFTSALIDDSTVHVKSLDMDALNDTTLDAFGAAISMSIGGSVGATINGAGAAVKASNITYNTTEALIRNGSLVTATTGSGDVDIKAEDSSEITADLTSVAVSIGFAGGGAVNIGVSATLAENQIGSNTYAGIGNDALSTTDGTQVFADSLVILAKGDATIDAFGLALSISAGGSVGLTIGASVSAVEARNTITGETEARIRNSQADIGGAITVDAQDTSDIRAELLSASVAFSMAGGAGVSLTVSATLAQNSAQGDTRAVIDNADVDAGEVLDGGAGTLRVKALGDSTIDSSAVAASISASGAIGFTLNGAGAGADSKNLMSNTVEASIEDGSDVDTTGMVTVHAQDQADIDVEVLSLAISAGISVGGTANVAVSVSLSQVDYSTQTLALIDDSDVTAKSGDIKLRALSTGTIDISADALAIAVGASLGASLTGSGAGSVARVTSSSLIEAGITGGSVVIAEDGSIIIDADDETIIHADALGVSVSFSVSGGLAVSDAVVATIVDVDFDGTVLATIDDSIATASGDITVNADSIAKSYANAGAVAISVSISAGISGAFGVAAGEVYNYLGQTVEASIIDAMPAEPTDPGVEAGGKVDVKAKDNGLAESETNAIAVAAGFSLAGGGSIAVSAAVTKSELRGSTRARIGGSKVEALDGDVTVDARSLSNLETRSLAFSLSASFTGLSAAGAGVDAVNTINREVRAQIFDGSEVTASDAVFVTASDDGMSSSVDVDSAAVSLSFFSAGASVGVGLGKNLITSAVFASIEDSTVNSNGTYDDGTMTGGEITVDAQSMHAANDFDTHVNVESVSASLGGPTTSIAGASAVLDIENTVEAFVSGSALSATGIAKIDAQSQHTAKPEVVGFSGSFSLGGLAATVVKAETEISGATRAYIDGVSSVSSTGDLNVTADSYAKADPQGGSLTASLGVGLGVSDFDSRVTRETAAYVGTRANPPKVFDPAEAVNTGNNIISLGYHGWQTGDQVRYDYDADNDGSGANIGNLSNGSTYYVIDLGDGNLQLASSYANALAGSEINLSGAGTGDDHSLQLVTQPTATELNLGSKNLHVLSNAELISHADASSFGFALAASANSALSDSRVEGATLAYIGQGAVVNAGDVEIKATSTDTAKSINKVASVAGGVAIQIGRALADVNSRTEAFVGALSGDVAANITTGVNVGSHDIDVIANTSMEADASMLGGGFALGANVTSFQPEAQVDGATRAYVRDGVGINASTLDIKAGEADDNRATYLATADVDSIGFAFLLAASDLTADARVTGVVEAFAGASKDTVGGGDPSAQISLSNPSALQILAYADINAIADTDGGGGSLLASVQSLAPTATAGGFTRAFVNDGADLAGHDVRLLADGDARSDASLFNVSLSGLISVTNLKPVAQTTNISETFLGRSLETATGDAAEIHVGDVDADAKSKSIAFASSFGLSATAGVGINSVRAESLLLGGTRSYVGQNTTLYADNVDLRAEDLELDPLTDVITDNTHPAFGSALTGLASSYVANLSFAGIASISELESRALASRETMAFVGNDSALHLGTHSLTAVADTVLNTPMANASIDSANGAGLVAVTDLNATATIGAGTGQVSATRSYIGDNTNVTAGTVSLNAVSDTEAEATVDAIGAAGLVNVSATNIVATAAHDTQAYVGDGAMLTLSGGLNIFAGSHVTASPSSGGFSFGGALTYGSTDIKTVLDSDTDAYIGDEVMITAPTVTMRAAAEHVGAATSSKGSASLGIAIEDIETIVEDRGSVNVRIGAESGGVGTSITTDAGGVDVDAYLESQVKSESKAVSFALFGAVPLVTSVALNEAEATGHIGDNVSIDAQQGDFDMLVDLIGVARGASAATGAGGVAVTKTTLDVDFNAGVSLTVGEDADIAASSDTGNVNLKALLNHTGDKFLTQEDDIDNYDQDLDLNLDMVADNTDDWSNAEGELGAGAIGSANAVAGAIAAVNAADILVGADSTMVVEVGNNSSLHTGGTGGVNVSGLHSNTALGTMSSTAVGIAAINGDVNVTPSAFGSNTVTFNGDVIDDEGSAAQSLSVRGELSSIAEGTLSSTTGGVVTVDGGDVIARTFNNFDPDLTDSYDPDPKDDKYADLKVNFGNGNTDINVAENVNVTASLYTDADARTTSQSIGLVAVGDLDTKSISKGVVDLELGADQNVVAGGDINIKAGHAIGAERASDGTVVSSDDTSNLIDFGAPHNLSDGASIVFTGQDAVLENGRAYTIVKDGANTLHLGASFNGASVLTAYDTINFGFDHNLQNGDVVYYHDNGGTPIGTRIDGVAGSLVDGQAYEVFVVDSDSIKLQEIGQATPSVTVTRSAVGADGDSDDDTINVANSFVDGQVVTYHVPEPIPFSSQTVDANVVVNDGGTPDFPDDDTGSITNDGSNRIFLPNHGLYIGQAVRYTATGTPTIVVAGG